MLDIMDDDDDEIIMLSHETVDYTVEQWMNVDAYHLASFNLAVWDYYGLVPEPVLYQQHDMSQLLSTNLMCTMRRGFAMTFPNLLKGA
jgi:hypothetical protein